MGPLLTIHEVADLAGVTVDDVKKMPLPFYRIGRSRMYARPDLVEAGIMARPAQIQEPPQPKFTSCVYFISYRRLVKIGTAKQPKKRFAELQCGSPVELRVLGVMPGDKVTEAELHEKWGEHRHRGEWFHLTPEIRAFIKANCSAIT